MTRSRGTVVAVFAVVAAGSALLAFWMVPKASDPIRTNIIGLEARTLTVPTR